MSSRPLSADDRAFVDKAFTLALLVIVAGLAAAGWTDTDIWGHMSIGLDMLQSRTFLWVDPYSFASDQAWINHEWAWEIVSAAIYSSGGLPALVAFRALLAGTVLWCVYRATGQMPGHMRLLVIGLVAVSCMPQWRSTRPQIASLALFSVLLTNLDRWWLPLMFTLWANVHGSWLIGLAALGVHAMFDRTRRSVVIAGACVAATLINPYGPALWTATLSGLSRGFSDITEWRPIWSVAAGADALLLWLVVLAALVVLSRHVRWDSWSWTWIALTMVAAANTRRLLAFPALSAALLLGRCWRTPEVKPLVRWTYGRRWMFGAGLALSAAVAGMAIRPSLSCFPPLDGLVAPEPDAVAFLRQAPVRRVVVHFDYGEYAIFHLRDRLRVSMDNRHYTVYSDAAIKASDRFAAGSDPEYPDRIGADAVWWPSGDGRVLGALEARGWVKRFDGPRTVVLTRTPGDVMRGRETVGTPCFPNP